ncbi:sirohydrochlorin chelatase [Streptomyces polyrhachis]|uniref:Sirohydrochlorin chelatase n=1 Tax=Streptomyces polyrhachis TaxID=1282885 RepID=A0ABW2GDZ2_9ACTN
MRPLDQAAAPWPTADPPADLPAGSAVGPDSSLGDLLGAISAQANSRLRQLAGHRTAAPVLLAVAHGSRHPAAAATVAALLDAVRAQRPTLDVRLAHIELNGPLLTDVLADLRRPVILVPLLFTRGHHVTHDLPGALAAAPHLRGRVAAPLGPHPLLAAALHARLAEAGWSTGRRAGVVLAAAGSRAPDSAADTARTAALLAERLGGVPVEAAYASAASPRTHPALAEAVARLRARGCRRIALASCFAAPGLFAARMRAQAPGLVSEPLGAHPALARLVVRRYEEAWAGSGAQPTSASA